MKPKMLAAAGLAAAFLAGMAAAAPDAKLLFALHCAACHGAERLGGMGPALLPESLARLKKTEAEKVIGEGRAATQMPAFGPQIGGEAVKALAEYIYSPSATPPVWGTKEIAASRLVHHAPGSLPDKPKFAADPLNLFVVVEGGDHHVSILDGDRLEPIHRFPSRYALHGGPKFTPDGRHVYFASRDGWIAKFDLWNLEPVAEVRAGINTRNLAVSGDGKWVAVANYLPPSLVILDADLNPVKVLAAGDRAGKTASRVSAVYDAAPRHAFVAALKDVPEIWEVSYDREAPPIYEGLVHDYRLGEALGRSGLFNPRRTELAEPLDDFFFDQSYSLVFGATRPDGAGKGRAQVVNLDVRQRIAELDLPGMPHLGSGITFQWQGRTVMATPNLNEGVISVIDLQTWQPVKQIATRGPGFFLRSHEKSRYAWTDSMLSRDYKDTMQVIDKASLEIVAELRPAPGKTFAHAEFSRDGRHVLASLWENDGAVIVYDAATLKEVKRIPMNKPVGKYNVWNKITRSEGTSH